MPFVCYGTISTINPVPNVFVAIQNISVTSGTGYSSGTAVTNGVSYNVYSFTTGTYNLSFDCVNPTLCYVLAVGGGGSGGNSNGGGGGGAGGVVMKSISVNSATGQTMAISIGAGGVAPPSSNFGVNGSPTTISLNSSNIITATGGGGGGKNPQLGAIGGSNGGTGYYYGGGGGSPSTNAQNSNNYNFVNGQYFQKWNVNTGGGGGGGAGTAGMAGVQSDSPAINGLGSAGGNGIKCYLPGIKDYNITSTTYPSGTLVSNLYWGGGGGGASSNVNIPNYNYGGLGGGGGGAYANNITAGSGGGSGLNNGSPGANNNGIAGNAGTNTGSGGGGSWNNATSGSGGSGIVIIAFPSYAVKLNTASILTNTGFSSSAYASIKTALHNKLINYDYYGPLFNLRASNDVCGNLVKPFYADVNGNLGTDYLATGQSLSSWLTSMGGSTSYAYVAKWYDQGMDSSFNCAVQLNLTKQPIYDVANKVVNFGYTGGSGGVVSPTTNNFLSFPLSIGFPPGDTSVTSLFKVYNIETGSTNGVFQIGPNNTTGKQVICQLNNTNWQYSWYNSFYGSSTTYSQNNVVEMTYKSGQGGSNGMTIYVNGAGNTYSPGALNFLDTTTDASSNTLGFYMPTTTTYNFFNGQIYYFYLLNTVLSTNDYNILNS